mmetsp:Transcript_12527/g.22531  ORF Transcript_12527/g.22531 Transcript_12527/m.22531 type:complete len:208 (+) Transcript_12527:185-808(+)
MVICWAVDWRPYRLTLEEPHRMREVVGIHGEAVVDPFRKNDQVARRELHADPAFLLVADIKIATALQDVTNLIIRVDVLLEKCFQLVVVVWQTFFRAGDDVGVVVALFFAQRCQGRIFDVVRIPGNGLRRIRVTFRWNTPRFDAQVFQLFWRHWLVWTQPIFRSLIHDVCRHVPRLHHRCCRGGAERNSGISKTEATYSATIRGLRA